MTKNRRRRERRRAGSATRDAKHRSGGDWTSLSLPEGVDLWQPKEASYRIDIVPYEVGEGNPYASRGEWYYERTYYAHYGIGPNRSTYVCLAKTFGKPCPICEYLAGLDRGVPEDKEQIGKMKWKERQLWLVYDHKQEDKGIQLFEVSNFCFGKLLDRKRNRAEADEPHIIDFDDPAAGSTLKVDFTDERAEGFTYLKADSIDFKPRPDGLPEELLDHGVCLDDLLKIEPYDKLKAVLLQTGDDDDDDVDADDDDEERSEPSEDKEEDDIPFDEEESKPKRKRQSKSKSKPKPEPEAKDDEDDWDEEEEEKEEKPQEEKPKRGRRPKSKSESKPKPKPEPEAEDDDDDWDEDEDFDEDDNAPED